LSVRRTTRDIKTRRTEKGGGNITFKKTRVRGRRKGSTTHLRRRKDERRVMTGGDVQGGEVDSIVAAGRGRTLFIAKKRGGLGGPPSEIKTRCIRGGKTRQGGKGHHNYRRKKYERGLWQKNGR